MYFGRRLTALSAAVLVFTLETHDSGIGGQMPARVPPAACKDCQPDPGGTPPTADTRAIRSYRSANRAEQHAPHNTASPSDVPEPHGSAGAQPPDGWLRYAAVHPGFAHGPSYGGGGSSPGPGDNPGNNTDDGGESNGGSGPNGDTPDSPLDTPANPGETSGGNGGGPSGPPIDTIDPPPGGYPPPDGPITTDEPPGGNANIPGTTDVPEPASLIVVLAGLAGLATIRRRRRPAGRSGSARIG